MKTARWMKTVGLCFAMSSLVFALGCGKTEKEKPAKNAGVAGKGKQLPKAAVTKQVVKPGTGTPAKAKAVHLAKSKPWHQGTVEAAMAQAKKDNKPIFLYWGAVWCPPCNMLKASVFSKPEFPKVMERFVSVYLDGDTERAQAWGEKLKAMGYPTMLFLDPAGNELLRLSAGLTWAEFVARTDNVLARMKPLEDIVTLAKAGKAKKGDWQLLASLDAYGLKTRGKKPIQVIDTLHWLANAVPAKLVEERAAVTANMLTAVATTKDKEVAAKIAGVRKDATRYLDAVFATVKTRKAAREMILYAADDVVTFLYGAADAKTKKPAVANEQRAALIKRWLEAARELRGHEDLPVVVRMDTLWPEVLLFRVTTPKGDVPAALRKRVVDTVTADVKKLTSPFLRKSGISDATQLLRRVGAFDEARKLLDEELKTTTTPWYYMSSYASLEKNAGNHKAALAWAGKARMAAKGGATKLQWIANDLSMTNATKALKSDDKNARMTKLVKGFYDLLLQLPDGFYGRNHRVAKKVARTIKGWKDGPAVKPLLSGFAARCKSVAKGHQPLCVKHFTQLLAPGKS